MNNDNPYHKIVSCSSILLLLFCVVTGCDIIVDPKEGWDKTENLVAFKATFPGNTDDSYLQEIIIADFNDLDTYEVVTREEVIRLGPVLSEDKSRILFGVYGDEYANPEIKLFNIHKSQTISLEVKTQDDFTSPATLHGENVVWNEESTGFYYGKNYPDQGAYFYSFSDSSSHTLRLNVFPLALKDSDSLIVYGNPEDPEHPHGFYLMDTKGDYVERIDQSYWDDLEEITKIRRRALDMDYNRQLDLLVFIIRDPEQGGYKVAVTNLEGNYYKEYTGGNYIDGSPRWGPDGTIYFDRMPIPTHSTDLTGRNIMQVDTETGKVTEFITSDEFPESLSLSKPEF